MQGFLFRSLYLVSPATIMSAGSYYTYSYFWPKKLKTWLERSNVKWIDKEDNKYKAMFNDNKSQVSDLKEEGLTNTTSETDALTKLKKWCGENLEKVWSKELEDLFLKFCVYDPRTVKALFISNGKEQDLITDDDDYKVVFTLYYRGTVKKSPSLVTGVSSSTDADTAKGKLKIWCEDEFNKNIKDSPFHDQQYSTLFDLCTKPQGKTVKERIQKAESNWNEISQENQDEQWKTAFEKWKNTKEVTDAIKKSEGGSTEINSTTDNETGGPKMKEWCKKGLEKKIYDEGVYPEEYKLLKSACKSS